MLEFRAGVEAYFAASASSRLRFSETSGSLYSAPHVRPVSGQFVMVPMCS